VTGRADMGWRRHVEGSSARAGCGIIIELLLQRVPELMRRMAWGILGLWPNRDDGLPVALLVRHPGPSSRVGSYAESPIIAKFLRP
jgi:hypothetical protein